MKTEEKQLLLKDLCGRLHTFLYVNIKGNIQVLNSWADDDGNFFNFLGDGPDSNYGEGFTLDDVKPYLRSMSSMTDEERREYDKLIAKCIYDPEAYFFENYNRLYDWLLSHHFDYRGLIPMGLALELPKDMYKEEWI